MNGYDKSDVQIFREARELIANGFTRGTCARDAAGSPCDPRSQDAVVFDVYGAILRACQPLRPFPFVEAISREAGLDDCSAYGLTGWSDWSDTPLDQILGVIDALISKLEARQ